MAEEYHQKSNECEAPVVHDEGAVETKDRGMFDFLGKKEEEKPHHHQEEVIVTEFQEKVQVSEPRPEMEEKKHSLLEKLHRSGSSSSSSSDEEEEGEGDEKKKKKKEKKGLKEKISGDKEEKKHEDTTVPVERCDEAVHQEPTHQPEEKKGFLEKIKEKLPGQHKKTEEVTPPPAAECAASYEVHQVHEGEAKEKKGILEKIKEKLPGYHPKTEEEKDKEQECASH